MARSTLLRVACFDKCLEAVHRFDKPAIDRGCDDVEPPVHVTTDDILERNGGAALRLVKVVAKRGARLELRLGALFRAPGAALRRTPARCMSWCIPFMSGAVLFFSLSVTSKTGSTTSPNAAKSLICHSFTVFEGLSVNIG